MARRRRRNRSEMVEAEGTAMSEASSYAEPEGSEMEVEEPDEVPAEIAMRKPLSEDEYQSRISGAVAAAEDFVDTVIAPSRELAAEYYRGAPFGDEELGRSQIVLSEVRDTIQSILPSLMRVFCSGQRIVEYMPRTAEDVQIAEQASDAVNFVFNEMNHGFEILHSAFKDALLKKAGIITWWARQRTASSRRNSPACLKRRFSSSASSTPRPNSSTSTPKSRRLSQSPSPTRSA